MIPLLGRWVYVPDLEDFESVLQRACQLWVISSSQNLLQTSHLHYIENFFRMGKGLFLWGDNCPWFEEANVIGTKILSTSMHGNVMGDQSVGLKVDGAPSGFLQHEITTGLSSLYEGITIATIVPQDGVKPLMYGSAGNLVTAYYDDNGCRCIFDGGCTRLYHKWDEAGQPRFVVNCAAWLANLEALQ